MDLKACERAKPDISVREWVEGLARNGLRREAVAALAQLLPRRSAIGWALDAIHRIAPPAAGTFAAAAFESAERWLENAGEDRRLLAGDAAANAGYGSPAGCLALAVFLSGGNIAPRDTSAAAEPFPWLCGRTVAGAMELAIASRPREASENRRLVLEEGFRLADRTGIWNAAA